MNKTFLRGFLVVGLLLAVIVSKHIETNRLNKISIVSAIGIETKKNEYIVTLQVFNPSPTNQETASNMNSYTYTTKGKNIADALERLNDITTRRIFIDTTQVVILGEQLIRKEGISKVLDFLMRDSKLPGNIKLVVAKDIEPSHLLYSFKKTEKPSGIQLISAISSSYPFWGVLGNISPQIAKSKLLEHTSSLTLPCITIQAKEKQTKSQGDTKLESILVLDGFVVFQGDKAKHFLSYTQSKAFVLTQNSISQAVVWANCSKQKNYLSYQTTSIRSKIIPSYQNGALSFTLDIHMKGNVNSDDCGTDFSKPSIVSKMEKQLEKKVNTRMRELVATSKKQKSDFIGFADELSRKYPKEWRKIEKNWEQTFPTVPIHVKSHVQILQTGTAKKIPH